MKIRISNRDDLPKVIELLNMSFSEEYPPFDIEGLSYTLGDNSAIFVYEDDTSGITGAIVSMPSHLGREIYAIGVKEQNNKDMVEGLLVSRVEELACEKGEEKLYTLADSKKEIEKWEKSGFSENDGMYHMIAPLEIVEPIPFLKGPVVLRSLRKDEGQTLVDVVNLSFGWKRLSQNCMSSWSWFDNSFDESWVQVAEIQGKVVSAVVSMADKAFNEHFGKKRGYLGPAGTIPEFRGRNIASALTRFAMNFLIGKGMDSVSAYAWSNNKPSLAVLKSLGFKATRYHAFLSKDMKITCKSTSGKNPCAN